MPPGSSDDRRRKAAAIGKLLSHFWTDNVSAAIREMQAADWLEDVEEFEASMVEEACRRWRRQSRNRPVPYDLIALCLSSSASSATATS